MNCPTEAQVSHHMRSLVLTIALLGLAASCTKASKGPLSFQTPAHWKAEYQPSSLGLDLYSVTATDHYDGLLMFTRWPLPTGPEGVSTLVKTLADRFLKKAQQSPNLTLASQEYRIETFTNGECQGSCAIFQMAGGGRIIFQTMFAMSVNGKIWYGQYTGSSNEWIQALTVLKSVRKSG